MSLGWVEQSADVASSLGSPVRPVQPHLDPIWQARMQSPSIALVLALYANASRTGCALAGITARFVAGANEAQQLSPYIPPASCLAVPLHVQFKCSLSFRWQALPNGVQKQHKLLHIFVLRKVTPYLFCMVHPPTYLSNR
eukprot:1142431-Pelagomonas_calceolata.AAC.3